MRTLGIDLASQAERTGACLVEWGAAARVLELRSNTDDDELLALHRGCRATGIDAPFGWPLGFARLVGGERPVLPWTPGRRDALRYRVTDRVVREDQEFGLCPLSVSSDLIAVPAMRCAGLLAAMGVRGLEGVDGVFETYPAAALKRWRFSACRRYKEARGSAVRARLVGELIEKAAWLELDDAQRSTLEASDHAFDALIAALVARAAACGLTDLPSADQAHAARREGWIHLPKPGSLGYLLPGEY